MLWRALRHVGQGRYIEVGANHPCNFSVSMAFYQKGWSGITVEPDPEFAQLQRRHRPNDIMVEAAITANDGDSIDFPCRGRDGAVNPGRGHSPGPRPLRL